MHGWTRALTFNIAYSMFHKIFFPMSGRLPLCDLQISQTLRHKFDLYIYIYRCIYQWNDCYLNEIVSLIYQSSLPRLSTLRSFLEHSLIDVYIYISVYIGIFHKFCGMQISRVNISTCENAFDLKFWG